MVSPRNAVTLNVLMNGRLVGYFRKLSSSALVFQYATEWLATPGSRPVFLSLPLEGDRVYNFFDNLLPDSEQIRAMIQTRFRIARIQSIGLIASASSLTIST